MTDAAERAGKKINDARNKLHSHLRRTKWFAAIIREEQDAEGVAERIMATLIATGCIPDHLSASIGGAQGKIADLIRQGRSE